ncbi:MAG TPA: LysE family translocator [Thermoanaerobaculia bacterium]|nr:LysE family translocator [Thermoanaerobaculia bacterium]
MSHLTALWLFFLLVAGVVALPGLDMTFVVASSFVGGRRAGLAAIAGSVAGGVVHVTMATLGIAVVLQVMPKAFNAVLLAGSLYVAWIGWTLMRSGIALDAGGTAAERSWGATFRRGALTNLLNPKAYVFTLAVFPQFMRAEYGPIWIQAAEMSAIIMLTQASIYGAVALLAGRARGWLTRSPAARLVVARTVGALLIAVAVVTGIEGWRLI